jgi:hypothetical protein
MATPATAAAHIDTGLFGHPRGVLAGMLYADGDTRRDAGFSIYYMGIKLGAFIASDRNRAVHLRRQKPQRRHHADQRRYDRNAPHGVADPFRTVEDDHDVARKACPTSRSSRRSRGLRWN